MRIGEFSFFFPCIILANGLIMVLPSVRATNPFTPLAIREVVDLFRCGNVENHHCKPDKDCHETKITYHKSHATR